MGYPIRAACPVGYEPTWQSNEHLRQAMPLRSFFIRICSNTAANKV